MIKRFLEWINIIFLVAFFFLLPFLTHAFVLTTPSRPLNSGLVGYWTFDGKDVPNGRANDVSGNGKHGNLISIATSTFYTQGKIGQGFRFDGVNDRVLISTVPTITQPYTVSIWFKFSILGTNKHILTFGSGNPTPTVSITGSNLFEIDAASAGSFRTFCNKTFNASDLNKWWHVTYIVNSATDASQWKCYLNGIDVGTTNSNSSGTYMEPPSTNWTIGNYPGLSSRFWNGFLDDVRVYNRALSATEIRQLYNQGAATKIAVTPMSTSAKGLSQGLLGHWTFDGKDVPNGRANDVSGNGNHGSLTNISTSTFYAEGKIGQGFRFDGGNDRVDTSSDSIDVGADTICAWMHPLSLGQSSAGRIISNNKTVILIATASTLKFISDGTTQSTSGSGITFIGKWNHVCVNRNSSGTANFYVNGLLSGTANQSSGTPVAGTANVTIGNIPGGGRAWDGSLDDVRIYNRALSATEIRQLYNQGAATKIAVTPMSTSAKGLSQGLLGHWTFDGKDVPNGRANDVSGNGNHGSLTNISTSTFYAEGKIGQGFRFDGVDDKVTVPSTATLNPSTITLAFWANIPGPGVANNTLIELGSNVNNFRVRDTNGELQLLTNSAGNNLSGATNSLVYGQWTHWVFIGNSSGLSIYKNGILNASNATAYTASANAVWNIGSAGFFIKQTLDDVRIYNRTLSATEIRQLYNQGR